MSRFFFPTAAVLTLTAAAATAQTAPATCSPFGLLDNTEQVYQVQDARGKALGTVRNRVVSLGTEQREQGKKAALTVTTVLLKSGTYDTRNKLLHQQDLTFRCRQDTSFTDGTAELDPEKLNSFRDRRFAAEPTPLAWPNQPTVGSGLPAGGITVQVSSSAVDIAKVQGLVRNRRITGTETITTPAGTFQCYKVEAERETATIARADIAMRTVNRVVDYYAPNVGLVKTEVYDKKGRLEQVRLLTTARPDAGATGEKNKAKSKKS